LVGSSFWGGLVDWIRERMLAEKSISPDDMDIFQVIDDPEQVVRTVTQKVII